MSRRIPLYQPVPVTPWHRLAILVWWLFFLEAIAWSALCWWGLNMARETTGDPLPVDGKMLANALVMWLPGVLPFLAWTTFRWVMTGRWLLRP